MPKHSACLLRRLWHASCVTKAVDLRHDLQDNPSFVDRIDELSRLALLVLLLATLACVV